MAGDYADRILTLVAEYKGLNVGEGITNPSNYLFLGKRVCISHQAIKHIVEQRGELAQSVLLDIPLILANPTKISDNSHKRPGSFLYARMNGKVKAVVVEIAKTPDDKHQVVSAFPMYEHTYRKLVDISGGPHVPSLDIA